ncbi:MAG: hypothetical protein KJ000_27540 [Pirellulaceae bacterium]|nr:hypothetical protein [Pirellulaceae bacterium]
MTRHRPCRICVLLLFAVWGTIADQSGAAEQKPKSGVPLAEPPIAAVRQILEGWDDPHLPGLIDSLGERLAVQAEQAAEVLDLLEREKSIESATLRADLLIWIARGDETPSWKRKTRTFQPDTMDTDELGRRAAKLLDHPDPFLRSLAEWAIAIRLATEYECAEERVNGRRMAKAWPDADAPDWYRKWAAIGPDTQLEMDYVRQAAARGLHRTTKDLVADAAAWTDRSEELSAYVRQAGTPEQATIANEHQRRVAGALRELTQAVSDSPGDLTRSREGYLHVRRALRQLVFANPDIDFDRVVFGVRQAPTGNGNITVGRWNTHTPGGDIYVKRGFRPEDPAEPLLAGRLGPGHVRGLELSWDADRLVFAYAKQPGMHKRRTGPASAARESDLSPVFEGGEVALPEKNDLGGYFGQGVGAIEEMSHLFEMNIDGTGLRQLTDEPLHADQEPTYLPNGDIVFVSDRSFFGSQCAGALEQDNMILNLYRCDPDGGNIRPLSNNKDFDRHPHVMDTGQLLFLHWEYQERHLWQTHTLWTSRPDGSMADALYKQHIETGPMSLREARQIYGHRKLVAIACGHHNYDQGAVFLVNFAAGINEREGMRNVTPGVSGTEGGYGGVKPVPEGGVRDGGGHYMFPYPLSDRSFLAAYSYKRPEESAGQNFSLYYIDVWGNKELIHRDQRMSVAFLSPVRPAPRPPILEELPPAPADGSRYAVATVADVHAGWPDAETARIRFLRISQKVPWPCVRDESKSCGFNDLHWMPAAWDPVLGMWDWGAARVIGVVPVEADGSAHFKVPADQTVYFQALDENFLELRRMRSNVTFRAGESRGCIGCHESRATTLPNRDSIPLAMLRAPSTPVPPAWGDRIVPDYEQHIQPIFERHCVRCHGEHESDGGLEFTSRRVDGYLQSYRTLFGLTANDPTPVSKNYWSIWHPNEPPLGDEAASAAKAFLKNVLRDPPASQLITVADYTGGAEVTQPLQFGSAKSKLTLTLLNDPQHVAEVKLAPDEWMSLVTWVDLNAQYWGTFVEKDGHYASRRGAARGGSVIPPRRVQVLFPDPWQRPPAGQWIWRDNDTVVLK